LAWDVIRKQVSLHLAGGVPQVENFNCDRDFIYREHLIHFLHSVEHGTHSTVTLEDGDVALYVVEAARRSHKMRQKVKVA